MESDKCHICLEEVEYSSNKLIKECCEAFICNPCWIQLKEHMNITQCPICKVSIRNYIETSTQTQHTNSFNDYRKCILCFIYLILWIATGFLLSLITLLIVNYDNMYQFKKDIKDTCSTFHFWIIITVFGYLFIRLIKSCFEGICS